MIKKIFIVGFIILFCLCMYIQADEIKKITTYYPSPYGIYRELKLSPTAQPATCQTGELYYDIGLNQIKYCDGASTWQQLGGSGQWTLNTASDPDAIHPNINAWNVGIGTTTPRSKLEVQGGGVLFDGNIGAHPGVGNLGTGFLWYPAKATLRAGSGTFLFWNDLNMRPGSVAMGYQGYTGSGLYNFAAGQRTNPGGGGFSTGGETVDVAGSGVTTGWETGATNRSFASGKNVIVEGRYSVAAGLDIRLGGLSLDAGENSVVFGRHSVFNEIGGQQAVVIGRWNDADGENSVALGAGADARADESVAFSAGTATHERTVVTNLIVGPCQSTGIGEFKICGDTAVTVGLKTFEIPHPDPKKPKGTFLRHAMIESPTAGDNLYRWQVIVKDGQTIIQLPGYYKYLNKEDMVWVYPTEHFGTGYGVVDEGQEILTVYADSDGEYNILLIGTRKDKYASESWQGPEIYVEKNN